MEFAKVSILIPVYKVESFIEKCVRSLFEQTFADIEYIFVDDCSPDSSINILEHLLLEYPERRKQVKIIRNQTNKGIAYVRNILIENATGDYIYFVDSDDWIEKNTIELLFSEAMKTNAEIVGGDYFYSYVDMEYLMVNAYSKKKMDCLRNVISMDIKPVLWLFLIKRSLFVDNELQFEPKIDIGEDYIMCIKLFFYARKIAYISIPLYHYMMVNNNSYRNNILKYRNETEKAIKKVQNFFLEKGIYEDIKYSLDKRKYIFKTKYLLENINVDFDGYLSTFPELNGMWRKQNYRKDIQLYFYFVEKKMYMFARFLNLCRKLYRKLKY